MGHKKNKKQLLLMIMCVRMYVRIYTVYAYIYVYLYAKQKHLGCKKVRGQSEATLQYQLKLRSYFIKYL